VIDHRKCIGCHACTVACKEENQVPLGTFRTWVKYVEKGAWPHTRRYFSVLRCNHCDDAPCVTICPTVALYRRADGVVDLDGERCIGCKSCMQGCPYDALYIDPNTNTAAKCHYCAHRLEVGLEPACVIVCPERAIIAGDLDDRRTEIARLVACEQVEVRKPEQGTRPKVYYIGAESSALAPALQRPASTYLWGQRPAAEADLVTMVAALHDAGGDGALARLVYDAPHVARPWGWKVGAYLWTKSVAAGALLVAALTGSAWWGTILTITAPAISLLFVLLTTALLVLDLKRPERFLYILSRSNRRSWLVWGAWILIAFGVAATAWLATGLTGHAIPDLARLPVALLAIATAGYSAFLFGQAEGRDFWQSPLVLPHLIVSAYVAGCAALMMASIAWPGTLPVPGFPRHRALDVDQLLVGPLFLALLAHGALLLMEVLSRHPVRDAALAARLLTHGAYRARFWGGVLVLGTLVPMLALLAAVMLDVLALRALAALLALAGLWLWEDIWVKAGQSIPLS